MWGQLGSFVGTLQWIAVASVMLQMLPAEPSQPVIGGIPWALLAPVHPALLAAMRLIFHEAPLKAGPAALTSVCQRTPKV